MDKYIYDICDYIIYKSQNYIDSSMILKKYTKWDLLYKVM